MKPYAVVSHWIGETGDTEVTLCNSEEQALSTLKKLWKESMEFAKEDEDFDESNSRLYASQQYGVVAWRDGLYRYFEVVKTM